MVLGIKWGSTTYKYTPIFAPQLSFYLQNLFKIFSFFSLGVDTHLIVLETHGNRGWVVAGAFLGILDLIWLCNAGGAYILNTISHMLGMCSTVK